jgi:hypothetical protein
MLSLTDLNTCFEIAMAREDNYVGVLVDLGLESEELIINPRPNFQAKQEYYNNTYNEELQLKSAPHIKITGFASGFTLNRLMRKLRDQAFEIQYKSTK